LNWLRVKFGLPAKKQHKWEIYRIRKKAEYLGVVEAPDRDAAV
jgi:hypothetical protein